MDKETNKQKAQKAKLARAEKKAQRIRVRGNTETKVDAIEVVVSSKTTVKRWYARRGILVREVNGQRYRIVSPCGSTMKKDTRSGGPKSKVPKGC